MFAVADVTNMFFIALFTIEMFIKMYAVGFQGYFGSMFNRFDFFVIICSWAEVVLLAHKVINPVGVSVLRCARLLRVFKVTRSNIISALICKSSCQENAGTFVLMWGRRGGKLNVQVHNRIWTSVVLVPTN